MLDGFGEDGNLPRGEHRASWTELVAVLGFNARRQGLLEGLLAACRMFRDAGCEEMLVDGSFATAKRNPKDYDCCYSPRGMVAARLDPVLLDTSDRKAMKEAYGGEFWPSSLEVERPEIPFVGTIRDFFQRTNEDVPQFKGIVALDLKTLP